MSAVARLTPQIVERPVERSTADSYTILMALVLDQGGKVEIDEKTILNLDLQDTLSWWLDAKNMKLVVAAKKK